MKVCIVLSGCGVMDGSEIHEAVLTMLSLDRAGAEILYAAPATEQLQVVNHCTSEVQPGETRNMLVEAARISRGDIRDLAGIGAADADAVIFPGGFGAAKNLCSFARDGADCSVHAQAGRIIREMLEARKPIGALCIAPVLVARVAGESGRRIQVTIGSDPEVAAAIEAMGAVHVPCSVDRAVIDENHRVVTAPAYMLAQRISEVSASAEAVVSGIAGLLSH